MLLRLRSLLPHLRRAARRRRRLLGVLLTAGLLAIAVPSVLPERSPQAGVVQAARPLERGHVLDASDLRTVQIPRALVPPGSGTDPSALIGLRLPSPLHEGDILRPEELAAEAAAPDTRGLAQLVLPVDPSLRERLVPGDALSIVLSTPDPGQTLVVDAVVVDVPVAAATADGGELWAESGSGSQGTAVIVGIAPPNARDVAYATHEGWFLITFID